MRPAPPERSSSNDDHVLVSPEPAAAGGTGQPGPALGSSRRPHRPPARIAVAVLAVAVVAGSVYVALSRGGASPTTAPSQGRSSPVPTPARSPFVFPQSSTVSVSTSGGGGDDAERIADRIRSTLSAFYDTAFLDPSARKDGLPPDVWDAFDEPLRAQAMKDAEALTLGPEGSTIVTLESTKASLTIKLLFDPKGRPEAGVADVDFRAEGTAAEGGGVLVKNSASFILRPFGGHWLIVGYPSAITRIRSLPDAAASPSTAPSGTASP